ncbi:MAG: hypothetical protein HKO81_05525 [Flavobacteriaceae bacterium]|nr:hypothetical protein [Flavobacteriaceae bacterium]
MFSKLLVFLFTLLQDQEVTYTLTEDLTRLEREDNLAQLVSLLTIVLIIVLAILVITLIQKQKLRRKVALLEADQ